MQYVNCMILYMPHNFFMNASTILRIFFLLATCACIYIAPAYVLFKFDEFYISNGALSITFTISYTVVCGVSQ